MTEQEAIKEVKRWTNILMSAGSKCVSETAEAQDKAIKALEEVEQYRAIGTPEECRAAVEVKKEITEIVNRQLIAGKDNYKETYNCFYEIVKIIQDNY